LRSDSATQGEMLALAKTVQSGNKRSLAAAAQ
jgi:hypothetical protein